MAEIPNVCLSLSNRPENLLVVRQALTGVADCLGLHAIETNDLNTAVTEACNNVVLHAYGGEEGPLEVDAYVLADAIAVVVRDRGNGMPSREQHHEESHTGMGLPVINALCRRVELTDPPDGGTEVRMEFAAAHASSLEPLQEDGQDSAIPTWRALPGSVQLRLAPNALARAVLPRVLSALAARAYFSTDRIADIQLLADMLAANAGDSISGGRLDVSVTTAPRNVELRIGPLCTRHDESKLAATADGLALVIERLTDETHRVAHGEFAETLQLRLLDRR